MFLIFSVVLYNLSIKKNLIYQNIYESLNNIYITSSSTPRGRILDINGEVLVDNEGIKTLVYHQLQNITLEEEIATSLKLSEIITLNNEPNILELKKFYLLLHPEINNNLLTNEEKELYNRRKLTKDDLNKIKLDRIEENDLNNMSVNEQKAALIYSLMNKGYAYEAKVIKKDITDMEYTKIIEENLPGIQIELFWERKYLYGEVLRNVLGSVGKIPAEELNTYLKKGYSLNDDVGISYLEKQYEDYLKGTKAIYKVNDDNSLSLIQEGKRGNDLYLSIDIKMQLEVEDILKEQIKKGKALPNTEYYKGSYVLVSEPSTGAIKVMAGLKYLQDDVFLEREVDVVNSSFTVGSVVKGASMTMAYQNNLIEIGKKINDSCVKLYNVPAKCSYKYLGYVDDITALKTSSNYYQFLLAIKLTGLNYHYDMKLPVSEREFNIYRDTFKSYGLGAKTGIDLPNEATGITGKTIAPDLLLNLAIGQYDTYTPLGLLQYINTIAMRGKRFSLSLMHQIVDNDGQIILSASPNLLNQVALEEEYYDRIETGLWQVINLGTGGGYASPKFNPVGKTGTSESYYDSDNDGKADVLTITNTFAMYAPQGNPKYSLVVVSPNVSHYNGKTNYFAYINRYISKAVSDYIYSLN